MGIAAHQDDRAAGAHRVELRHGGLARPGRRPVSIALQHWVCRPVTPRARPVDTRLPRHSSTHQVEHRLGRCGARGVDAPGLQRPLGEVDVRVPQPGNRPATLAVEHHLVAAGPQTDADIGHRPSPNAQVDLTV